jgi:predicted nucleic acid-binding protein
VLIIDTGVIVAAADRNDSHHNESVELIQQAPGPLVTTGLVIAECAYLIQRQLGPIAEATIYQSIVDDSLQIEMLQRQDWIRIGDLVTTYADLPLGGTDASVIAIAERLGQTRIATLDHRHFSVVRPASGQAFELAPS